MNDHRITPIDELATWVKAYREACANRDNWGEIADRAKQHISQALEEAGAQIGTVNGRPAVRYTEVTSQRLDAKKLKAVHPDLAAEFMVTSHSRRFTLVEQPAEVAS